MNGKGQKKVIKQVRRETGDFFQVPLDRRIRRRQARQLIYHVREMWGKMHRVSSSNQRKGADQ